MAEGGDFSDDAPGSLTVPQKFIKGSSRRGSVMADELPWKTVYVLLPISHSSAQYLWQYSQHTPCSLRTVALHWPISPVSRGCHLKHFPESSATHRHSISTTNFGLWLKIWGEKPFFMLRAACTFPEGCVPAMGSARDKSRHSNR